MLINIQALRGFAAILVLLHHTLPHFNAMNLTNPFFEFIAPFSFVGVDMFFVISGFVMAKTTDNTSHNIRSSIRFIKKRFARVYLGFWPVFFLTLIYYYQFNPNYLESKNIIQSFLLINANMYDLVITPAWSLTYELYFYMIIALLLMSQKFKPKIMFTLLILIIIVKNIVVNAGNYKYLDFFFSSLIVEFISGYFLYHLLQSKNNGNIMILILFTIISLCIAVYFNIGYGYLRVLTFGVFAFFIVWLFILLEQYNVYTFNRFFKAIGDCSYTLYLTHSVLLGIFFSIGLRDYLVQIDFAMIGIVLYVVFIIFFSWVFYKVVEKPLYQCFRNKLLLHA